MFFGIFLGPIFAILLFNAVIFVVVGRVIIISNCTTKSVTENNSNQKTILKTFISMTGVMFLFGLSWIFAAFSVKEASYTFEVLFIIFNAPQGFFLFAFICLFNPEIRQEWFHLFYGHAKLTNKNDHRVQIITNKCCHNFNGLDNSKSYAFELKSSDMSTCETGTEDSMDSEIPPQVTARRLLRSSALVSSTGKVQLMRSESEQRLLKNSESGLVIL